MSVVIFTHPDCLHHDPGPGHPERVERLRAILAGIQADPQLRAIPQREAPRATAEQLQSVHSSAHCQRVMAACAAASSDPQALDADTIISAGSHEAALRAAGAVVAAVDTILADQARAVFCAVRPPGHHAEPSVPMGFCLYNNIAIGAAHALAGGVARVAVLDFDVHHGNGTQAWAWTQPAVFFASSHQSPLYPGTGEAQETGAYGNICNVPLAPHSGSAEFRAAWQWQILPALDRFQPRLLMVSAGFDAHRRDPLASLALEAEDFAWLTRQLLARGPLVMALEGGYDLVALADSSAAVLHALLEPVAP